MYQDDNKAAAKELASALTQAQSAPIYVPNFGQVQVTGITQVDSPITPQFTRWVNEVPIQAHDSCAKLTTLPGDLPDICVF